MSDAAELVYSLEELRSVLPSGWSIESNANEGWASDRAAFVATVRDGSNLRWDLTVKQSDARALGRPEALRQAMIRLRRRL